MHIVLPGIGIDLIQQCLLIIKIFITVFIHFCIIFPVILMHGLDLFFALGDPALKLIQLLTDQRQHSIQKFLMLFHDLSPS